MLGLWLGFSPLVGAFTFSLLSAAIIGPLADRGELSPETSLGVIFSLMPGLARAKGFNGNIDYLCADVTNIPLHNGIFDIIVCYSSFPHFQDKPRALAEINRVIKSGGRLLICHTSSRARVNEIHRQIPAVENDIIPDEVEMQIILLRAGFIEVEIDDSESYLASARKPK